MTVVSLWIEPMKSVALRHCPSSSSSIADLGDVLPHLASEDEDWLKFGYLLDAEGGLRFDVPRGDSEEEVQGALVIRRPQTDARDEAKVEDPREISLSEAPRLAEAPKTENSQDEENNIRKRLRSASSGSDKEKTPGGSSTDLSPTRSKKPKKEFTPPERSPATPTRGRGRPPKMLREEKTESDLIDPAKLHCLCQKPYNPKKFYVNCENCGRWFHGACVGVSERSSRKEWTCEECRGPLYCVCQTPYDDSKFYVGCDGCEGWFHPDCVGITQSEAERAEVYMCPTCGEAERVANELQREDYEHLWDLFNSLRDAIDARPRQMRRRSTQQRSPSPDDAALTTIRKRLERGEYVHVDEFEDDLRRGLASERENIIALLDQGLVNLRRVLHESRLEVEL